MFIDLIFIFIAKSYLYLQRSCIGRIALFALFDRIFDIVFTQCKIHKFQTQVTCEIRDRGDISKHFFQSLIQEPLIRVFLNLNQIRHFQNFFLSWEGHPYTFTGFYRTHPAFLHSMFHPCFLSISMVCIFPSPNQPCFMPPELHCHLGIRIPGKHSFPQ